jgi:acetyl esterase/lipase
MSSERDSFAKGIFSTFAKGFLLHKLLLKVNYSPLRVKKSRSHDMGQCLQSSAFLVRAAVCDKSYFIKLLSLLMPTTINHGLNMSKVLYFLALWSLIHSGIVDSKVIKLKDNDVILDSGEAKWKSTLKDRLYDAYLGIPYAEPPLGDLRFALPVKSKVNGKIHVGMDGNTNAGSTCTQMDFQEHLDGQEDCLHLHVFVPQVDHDHDDPLPVMVWIHGGGFFAGIVWC